MSWMAKLLKDLKRQRTDETNKIRWWRPRVPGISAVFAEASRLILSLLVYASDTKASIDFRHDRKQHTGPRTNERRVLTF